MIEFNARFGDPECLNIMALLQTDMTAVVDAIAHRRLDEQPVDFASGASIITYLVAPSYPAGGEPIEFDFDLRRVEAHGIQVHFASCEQVGTDRYRTVGSSRVLGLVTTAESLADAHARTQRAIADAFPGQPELEWRRDIGRPGYIQQQQAQTAHFEATRRA